LTMVIFWGLYGDDVVFSDVMYCVIEKVTSLTFKI